MAAPRSKNLAKILLVCLGLFAVGSIATVEGWNLHRQSLPGGDAPVFSAWLVDAVGRLWPLLVGSHSDLGQRLGSLGIILAGIGFWAGLAILGAAYEAKHDKPLQ